MNNNLRYYAYKNTFFNKDFYCTTILLYAIFSALIYLENKPIFYLILNLISLSFILISGGFYFFKKTVHFFTFKLHVDMAGLFAPLAFGLLSFIGDGPVTMKSGRIAIPENVWVVPAWQISWVIALMILILLVVRFAFVVMQDIWVPVLKNLAQYEYRRSISEQEFNAILSAPQVKKKIFGNVFVGAFVVLTLLGLLNGDATLWKLFGGLAMLMWVVYGYTLAVMHLWYSRKFMPGFDLKIEEV